MTLSNFRKILKKNFRRILLIVGFALLLFFFSTPNIYLQPSVKGTTDSKSSEVVLPDSPPVPVNINNQNAPDITAEGVVILDLPANMIIYQKNATDRFFPASTTKIITALVALDHYKLDDILTVNTVETAGRTMKLVSGEKLTLESLLYGALVHSANDAAYTIAENYPGGVEKFIEAMNQKAAALQLFNTHFTNPIGFDNEQNYTTPVDLAKLAKVALSNKLIAKIVSTKAITVSDESFTYFHPLTNVNELLGKVAGVAGVKTGYTENGGEILVSEVKKDNKSVLFVVLKSKDRFAETTVLIDWVFKNFVWEDINKVIPTNQN